MCKNLASMFANHVAGQLALWLTACRLFHQDFYRPLT